MLVDVRAQPGAGRRVIEARSLLQGSGGYVAEPVELARGCRRCHGLHMPAGSDLPALPRALGYAGLLPQAAAALVIATGSLDYSFTALALAFAYAALIFSFLGALWWGLAAAQPQAAPEWVWFAGVLPALLALVSCVPWAIGAEWPGPSMFLLAIGIGASAMVDRRLDQLGLCPAGWLRLRTHLSVCLAALTMFCALA